MLEIVLTVKNMLTLDAKKHVKKSIAYGLDGWQEYDSVV